MLTSEYKWTKHWNLFLAMSFKLISDLLKEEWQFPFKVKVENEL